MSAVHLRVVAAVAPEDHDRAVRGPPGRHAGRLRRKLRVELPNLFTVVGEHVQPLVGHANGDVVHRHEPATKGTGGGPAPGLEGPGHAVQNANERVTDRGEGLKVDPAPVRHAAGVDYAPACDAVVGMAGKRNALDHNCVRVEHPHDLVVVQTAVPHEYPELAPCHRHGVGALVSSGLKAEMLVVHAARLVFAERAGHAPAADLLVSVGAARPHAAPGMRLPHAVRDAADAPTVAEERRLVRPPDDPVHRPAAEASRGHARPAVHQAAVAHDAQFAYSARDLVLIL